MVFSGHENETSDPKLCTLQRAARAVRAKLKLALEVRATCDWVTPGVRAYQDEHQ
jgi:hypothetical protein